MKYEEGIDPDRIRVFREASVDYFHHHGRKDLSWRNTSDPWRILLAEILLRKTTAAQAESVYQIVGGLTPQELQRIPRNELEVILKPLGIHRERARLLKLISEEVSVAGRSRLADWDYLVSLPGVGPYAASMVLATAFGERRAGLDRNMIRVLERVFGIRSTNRRPHMDKELWAAAERLVPNGDPKRFNWGVLDISAEFCRPRNPRCAECPLNEICEYGRGEDVVQSSEGTHT